MTLTLSSPLCVPSFSASCAMGVALGMAPVYGWQWHAHRVAGKYQIPVEALKGKEVEGTWALYRVPQPKVAIGVAYRSLNGFQSPHRRMQFHGSHISSIHRLIIPLEGNLVCCCYSALLCCLPLAALLRALFLSPCPCTRGGTVHHLPYATGTPSVLRALDRPSRAVLDDAWYACTSILNIPNSIHFLQSEPHACKRFVSVGAQITTHLLSA